MLKYIKKYSLYFFVVGFSLLLISCSGGDESIPSDGSTAPADPVEDTPVGEVEATGFWINMQSDQFPIYVNSGAGWGTPCFIDATTTSNEDVTCYMDILEGDLYMYDLSLQYNSPPGLCEHVRVAPSWHWNYSTGKGPKAVVINVNEVTQAVTACTETAQDNTTAPCGTNKELFDVGNPIGPSCIYNYTGSERPNCCIGDYTLTVNSDTDDDGLTDSVTVTETNWGGDVKECIGGAGKTSWGAYTKAGYPSRVIYPVPENAAGTSEGLNKELTLSSNKESAASYFSTLANHYVSTANPHAHSGYVSVSTSNLPYSFNPIDDLDGSTFSDSGSSTGLRNGREFYTFECLDDGFEVKHRIRAYIREWNTHKDFLLYASSAGVTYNPDVGGIEGTGCDFSSPIGDNCNDRYDFDDILSTLGGSYDTVTKSNSIRQSFFPAVWY